MLYFLSVSESQGRSPSCLSFLLLPGHQNGQSIWNSLSASTQEDFSLHFVRHIVLGPPRGLSDKTARGARLLIELRICSDPRALAFICLIVMEGGD